MRRVPSPGAFRPARRQAGAIGCGFEHNTDEPIGFEGFFAQIALDLAGRENQAVTFEDGATSVALVTAIYHSARTGRQVELPLDPAMSSTKDGCHEAMLALVWAWGSNSLG